MVSLEEFYANAPACISQEEITRKDRHRQHLARLSWEMEERKKYCLIITFLNTYFLSSQLLLGIANK